MIGRRDCEMLWQIGTEPLDANKGALPPNPCIDLISCKDSCEVHVCLQRFEGNARQNPCISGEVACTSLFSLHEMRTMQEFEGSARQPARIWVKCTVKNPRENPVYNPRMEAGVVAWKPGLQRKTGRDSSRPA